MKDRKRKPGRGFWKTLTSAAYCLLISALISLIIGCGTVRSERVLSTYDRPEIRSKAEVKLLATADIDVAKARPAVILNVRMVNRVSVQRCKEKQVQQEVDVNSFPMHAHVFGFIDNRYANGEKKRKYDSMSIVMLDLCFGFGLFMDGMLSGTGDRQVVVIESETIYDDHAEKLLDNAIMVTIGGFTFDCRLDALGSVVIPLPDRIIDDPRYQGSCSIKLSDNRCPRIDVPIDWTRLRYIE